MALEGRAANGGFKIGTMERDALLSTGSQYITIERLRDQSDDFYMWVCAYCGLQAIVDKTGSIKECRVCTQKNVVKIRLPYGSKLLMNELAGMGIITRIITDKILTDGTRLGRVEFGPPSNVHVEEEEKKEEDDDEEAL